MTERDTAILDVARGFYRRAGAREAAMAELGLSPTRFWQRVHHLLDSGEAVAHDPVTVNRLRRQRAARMAARAHGT